VTVHGVGGGAAVELADGQQPGIAGELTRRRLEDQRRPEKIEDWRPDTW
jgi:hypothetical protein